MAKRWTRCAGITEMPTPKTKNVFRRIKSLIQLPVIEQKEDCTACVRSSFSTPIVDAEDYTGKIIHLVADLSVVEEDESKYVSFLRCRSTLAPDLKEVTKCRAYAHRFLGAKRVFVYGSFVWYAIFGRFASYGDYGIVDKLEGYDTEFVYLPDIVSVTTNHFWKKLQSQLIERDYSVKPIDAKVTHTWREFLDAKLGSHCRIGFDFETYGQWHIDFKAVCLSLCDADTLEACLVPEAEIDEFMDAIRGQTGGNTWIAHNAKFDYKVFESYDIKLEDFEDTRVLYKFTNPEATADLATMAKSIGYGGHKDEVKDLVDDKVDEGIPVYNAYAAIDRDILHDYCIMDTKICAKSYTELQKIVRRRKQEDIYSRLIKPAYMAVTRMECKGMPITGVQHLENFYERCEKGIVETKQRGFDEFGCNLNSPVQLKKLLNLESTAMEFIKDLEGPLVDMVKAYRKVTKFRDHAKACLASAYGNRIYASFDMAGAKTGRMSCARPNLQNVPGVDDGLGKEFRALFAPPEGYMFVQFDYEQVELRVAAYLSGDQAMLEAIEDGSYHMRTARLIAPYAWGIPPELVEEDKHKKKAKTVNFALLYGATDATIAERLQISDKKAKSVRAAIYGGFKGLGKYIEEQKEFARHHGYVRTEFQGQPGRVRWLRDAGSRSRRVANAAGRQAINTPIQGTATDICLYALAETDKFLYDKENNLESELVCAIHDSLIIVSPMHEVQTVIDNVCGIMRGASANTVPLDVSVEVGANWAEMEKL